MFTCYCVLIIFHIINFVCDPRTTSEVGISAHSDSGTHILVCVSHQSSHTSSERFSHSARTSHPAWKRAAIVRTTWVNIEISLMIILRIPPLPRRQNLRHDLSSPPLLARLIRHFPSHAFLLCIVIEDPGSVLGAAIRTL